MAGHYPHVLALADCAFRWAAKKDSEDLMRYVLENGAPVDINALLHTAEISGNPEAIALLMAKRAATEPLHSLIKSLHTACFYGQLRAVVALLDGVPSSKKVLCSKDHRGQTALHKAVLFNNMKPFNSKMDFAEREELIFTLVGLGADTTQRDLHGQTALDVAANYMLRDALKAAKKNISKNPRTSEETSSDVETMETLAETTQASSTDDEVSSLKTERGGLGDTAEKVDKRKRSWWRSLLSPEAHSKPGWRMPRNGLDGDP